LITAFNLAARGFQLLFFLSVGNRFGANELTDTVLFLQAPLLVLMSVAAGAAETVVMPAMHRAFENNCSVALYRSLKKRAVWVVSVLTVILLATATAVNRNATWDLLLMLFPIPLLAALSSIQMGALNAEGRYRLAVLGPLYGAVVALPLTFVLPLEAFYLAMVLTAFEAGRYTGLRYHTRNWSKKGEQDEQPVRDLILWAIRNAKLQAIASFTIALNPMVDFFFARTLGEGSVTLVEYSNRLWNVVPLLLSGHLTLAYAKMSLDASRGKLKKNTVNRHAIKLGALAIGISIVIILFTDPLIHLVYGFGNMDAASRSRFSGLLKCYIGGAGPFFIGVLFVRALSAEGRVYNITVVSAVSVVVNIIFNMLFISRFGLNGIGLATAFTYFWNALLLAYRFNKGD
jgi:putative peptidoglycan lipid II flippase